MANGAATTGIFSMIPKLWAPKRPEPSYPTLPKVDAHNQTAVKGVYAVGEVAGTPLVKLGLNAGHDLVTRLAGELKQQKSGDDIYDLIIVGAGSSGLGAASAAKDLGLQTVVLEANHLAETVYTMTRGKWLFAEPDNEPLRSSMWFEECTRETLLERWADQVKEKELDIRTFEKVEDIRRDGDEMTVVSTKNTYRGKRVILAIGKSGNPRKAGVPGEVEFGAKIDHRLIEPDKHKDQDIFIYGGGDVALECALTLCETNRVTLATIDQEFIYPKKRNIDKVMAAVDEGRITLHFDAWLKEIGKDEVVFTRGGRNGEEERIKNDHVFEMIGAELPLPFFEKVGIRMEGAWTGGRWAALFAMFIFVYSLYALKSYGKGLTAWPFESLIAPETFDAWLGSIFKIAFAPFAWLFTEQAYRDILADRGFQQGYLYSGLYTVVMAIFGYEASG